MILKLKRWYQTDLKRFASKDALKIQIVSPIFIPKSKIAGCTQKIVLKAKKLGTFIWRLQIQVRRHQWSQRNYGELSIGNIIWNLLKNPSKTIYLVDEKSENNSTLNETATHHQFSDELETASLSEEKEHEDFDYHVDYNEKEEEDDEDEEAGWPNEKLEDETELQITNPPQLEPVSKPNYGPDTIEHITEPNLISETNIDIDNGNSNMIRLNYVIFII